MIRSSFALFATGAGLLLAACTVTQEAPSGASPSSPSGRTTGAGGGASSGEIDACKASCDKMKFFDCSSAEEQARCYGECEAASAKQIELFTACADSSVCDPACRTNIKPAPSDDGKPPEGAASESSCAAACKKLVTCEFMAASDEQACVAECKRTAYQFQLDCVNNNACGDIQKACGGGTDPEEDGGPDANLSVLQCQTACDHAEFLSCLDAKEHATCRRACESASASASGSYASCTTSAAADCTKQDACYSQLVR